MNFSNTLHQPCIMKRGEGLGTTHIPAKHCSKTLHTKQIPKQMRNLKSSTQQSGFSCCNLISEETSQEKPIRSLGLG